MWLFLTIGDVNKDTKSKRKLCRQWWLQYFETFWYFTKFFSHHKWNEAWVLVINMVYMNYGFSRLVSTTAAFKGNFEVNNFLQDEMTSNSFWKIMTKFNFMCDVAAMGLVKLDIKKQRYSFYY